jgi:multiple sugar transport system substrate-binding protein
VEKKRFWKAGWYHPLNQFLQDATLTSPDFDWNDFSSGARAGVTQPDGSISALAAFIDANVFFYRKDLFGPKGLTPPKTLVDLETLAQKLHAPPSTYGIVLRGLKNANATQYPSILFPMGGTYLKDGKAALDSKEQVAALDLYTRLLRQYGPPGVVNFNWYECSASFMQGQVAIYMDGVNFASQFEDAAKSKVIGKVGYAVLPSGPGGHFSPIYITGMAVSAQSRNKEAAYLFAQWATNKSNAVRELMAGVGVGRTSTWDSPEVKAKPKMPADWYQAYQASLKIGRQGLPEIVGVTEYRDIIGVAIQKGIEGAPAAQVLAHAQKDFQDLLNRTEG